MAHTRVRPTRNIKSMFIAVALLSRVYYRVTENILISKTKQVGTRFSLFFARRSTHLSQVTQMLYNINIILYKIDIYSNFIILQYFVVRSQVVSRNKKIHII